jgi:hypothetical protein
MSGWTFNPFHVAEDSCPKCGAHLDAAMPVGKEEDTARPAPGDYSVCITCGALLVFEKNMRVRELSLEEMETMESDTVKMLLLSRAKVFLLRDMKDKGLI